MIELRKATEDFERTVLSWGACGRTQAEWNEFRADPRSLIFRVKDGERDCAAVLAFETSDSVIRLEVTCDYEPLEVLLMGLELAARFLFIHDFRYVWFLPGEVGLDELKRNGWLLRFFDMRGKDKADLIAYLDFARWQQRELWGVRRLLATSLN